MNLIMLMGNLRRCVISVQNHISASRWRFNPKIGGVIDRHSKSNQLNLGNYFGRLSIITNSLFLKRRERLNGAKITSVWAKSGGGSLGCHLGPHSPSKDRFLAKFIRLSLFYRHFILLQPWSQIIRIPTATAGTWIQSSSCCSKDRARPLSLH